MAGFKPNQPRDKEGQWSDAPDFGDVGPSYRPKANYKIARGDYGKPRTLIQRESGRNIGTGQKLPRTLKVKKVNPVTREIERDLFGQPLYEMVEGKGGKMVAKTIKLDYFSNLNRETNKRRNQNIGKPPTGVRGLPGRTAEGKFTQPWHTVIEEQKAQRQALMAKQRAQRITRDALVDEVIRNPHRATYYKIGKSRTMVTVNPVGRKVSRGVESTFNFLNKVTKKWF